MSRPTAAPPTLPLSWWRFPTGWLAFGLPLAAVVASTLSAVIAIRGADPVVDARRAAAHQAADEQAEHGPQAEARLPAEFARNHASMHK
ncbi:MAG TPA: nitrogen fixation protein FixH [Burkholderiaceae bacterium]